MVFLTRNLNINLQGDWKMCLHKQLLLIWIHVSEHLFTRNLDCSSFSGCLGSCFLFITVSLKGKLLEIRLGLSLYCNTKERIVFFFVFLFFFLKYTWFTMSCWFQVYSTVFQIYIYICVCVCVYNCTHTHIYIICRFFSLIGYYKVMSIVPFAIQWVLGNLFYM